MIAKHTLSLTPDYVLSWGFWEAVRELLQNSIDQHTVDPQSAVVFEYDPDSKLLTVGATNCKLEPRTLLLGMSGKTLNRKTLGQFGEGYKLALLVLTRSSYEVVVRNVNEIWKPTFEFSDEYQSSVLSVCRHESEQRSDGVFFDIRDVSQDDYAKITERYIPGTPLNRILTEDHFKQKVFVSELFVCEVPELEYGYNFGPDRLRLDRDRGMASSFDISYEASRLWDQSGDDEALYDNLKKGKPDTAFVHLPKATTNAYVMEQYLQETPNAIPVATDEEASRMLQTGHVVRKVPSPLRDLLRRMHKFVFNREGTPTERLERFQHAFGRQLNVEGRRELDAIVKASVNWAGPPELESEE
jgi:hypothetical protein